MCVNHCHSTESYGCKKKCKKTASTFHFERNEIFARNGPLSICRRALIDLVRRHRVNLRVAKLSSIPTIDPRDQLYLPTTLLRDATRRVTSLTRRRCQNSDESMLVFVAHEIRSIYFFFFFFPLRIRRCGQIFFGARDSFVSALSALIKPLRRAR